MTHAIGARTCNFSLNISKPESALIRLEALRKMRSGKFRSVGSWCMRNASGPQRSGRR